MDWSNDLVLQFLELYRMYPCIWNPKNLYHKNRNTVNDAWKQIQNKLKCSYTIKELKKKREILMSAYRGYKTKIKMSEKSGKIYQPIWYAFELMDSFLGSVYTCKESVDTLDGTGVEVDQTDTSSFKLEYADEGSSTSQQRTITPFKRRKQEPPELKKAEKQIEEALKITKTVSQRHQQLDDDDECTLFGKLVAKKLRRLSDDRRDLMMIKINELIYEESQHQNEPVLKSSFNLGL